MDTLGVLEDDDSEGFQNFIVNIFDMVLEYAPMFLPHAITQLEPNIFIEIKVPIHNHIHPPLTR